MNQETLASRGTRFGGRSRYLFEKTFTNPDPELASMVEEARRALEEAEAKAAS